MPNPLDRLRHHVTGAIERGEATPIEAATASHTPGPWAYTNEGDNCVVHAENGASAVAYTAGWYGERQEGEANARLIASAPALVEALREVSDRAPIAFVDSGFPPHLPYVVTLSGAQINAIRAALRNAGVQP